MPVWMALDKYDTKSSAGLVASGHIFWINGRQRSHPWHPSGHRRRPFSRVSTYAVIADAGARKGACIEMSNFFTWNICASPLSVSGYKPKILAVTQQRVHLQHYPRHRRRFELESPRIDPAKHIGVQRSNSTRCTSPFGASCTQQAQGMPYIDERIDSHVAQRKFEADCGTH